MYIAFLILVMAIIGFMIRSDHSFLTEGFADDEKIVTLSKLKDGRYVLQSKEERTQTYGSLGDFITEYHSYLKDFFEKQSITFVNKTEDSLDQCSITKIHISEGDDNHYDLHMIILGGGIQSERIKKTDLDTMKIQLKQTVPLCSDDLFTTEPHNGKDDRVFDATPGAECDNDEYSNGGIIQKRTKGHGYEIKTDSGKSGFGNLNGLKKSLSKMSSGCRAKLTNKTGIRLFKDESEASLLLGVEETPTPEEPTPTLEPTININMPETPEIRAVKAQFADAEGEDISNVNVVKMAQSGDGECPLKYVTLIKVDEVYHLEVQRKGSDKPEKIKVFSSIKKAKKFWNFLKLNNPELQTCRTPFKNSRALKRKLRTVAKHAMEANMQLKKLNNTLNIKGLFNEEEHHAVRRLAEAVNEHETEISPESSIEHQLEEMVKATQEKAAETQEDEQKYLKLTAQEGHHDTDNVISSGIEANKAALNSHAQRLDKLEGTLEETKNAINVNKLLLSEISSKLTNVQESSPLLVSSKNAQESESELLQNGVTVKSINKSLKCPVCPMYANTYPVNVLEVERQGVGTIVPVPSHLNYP